MKRGSAMLVFNLRQRRAQVLVGLVCVLVPLLGLIDVEVHRVYHEQELLQGPWGQGQGEFGQARGTDGQMYGPRSFCLDRNGDLYIADTFNARVQVYGRSGEWLRAFPLASGAGTLIDDLAVGDDGSLYAATGSGIVLRYALSGQPRGTFSIYQSGTLKKGDLFTLEAIIPGPRSRLYIKDFILTAREFTRRLAAYGPGGELLEVISQVTVDRTGTAKTSSDSRLQEDIHSLAVGPDGNLYLETLSTDPFRRRIKIYNPRSRLLGEILVEESEMIESSGILGTDGRGRIYFGLNLGLPGERITVLTPRGVRVNRLDIPTPPAVLASVYARVDRGGNLYLARGGPDGFKIYKFAAKDHIRFKLRFS